jgi:hypothetical protein
MPGANYRDSRPNSVWQKASNVIATATESEKKKAETKNKNPHENIVMDEVLREATIDARIHRYSQSVIARSGRV